MKFSRSMLYAVSALALVATTTPAAFAQESPAMPTAEECANILTDMGLSSVGADGAVVPGAPGAGSAGTPGAPITPGTGTGGDTDGPGGPGDDISLPGETPAPGATPSPTPTPTPTPVATAKPKPVTNVASNGSGPGGRVTLPTGDAAKCRQGMKMTQSDQASINRAKAAKATLQAAAAKHGIDWRILAAIGVRETGFRNIDSPRVGDPGQGVFQLTNQPGVTRAQAHNLAFAANYAAKMIADNKRYFKRKFPKFNETQLMHAAIAAYNFGLVEVKGNPERIDIGTAGSKEGRPYGESVLLAANCF